MPTTIDVNSDKGETNDDARSPHVDVAAILSLQQLPRRSLRILGLPPPGLEILEIEPRNSRKLPNERTKQNYQLKSAKAPECVSQYKVRQPQHQPTTSEAIQQHPPSVHTQKIELASYENDDCFIIATRKIKHSSSLQNAITTQLAQLPKEPPVPPSLPPFSTFHQFSSLTLPHRAPQRRPLLPGPPLTHQIQGLQSDNKQTHHLPGRIVQLPSFAELVESTTHHQNPPVPFRVL